MKQTVWKFARYLSSTDYQSFNKQLGEKWNRVYSMGKETLPVEDTLLLALEAKEESLARYVDWQHFPLTMWYGVVLLEGFTTGLVKPMTALAGTIDEIPGFWNSKMPTRHKIPSGTIGIENFTPRKELPKEKWARYL